MSSFPLSQEHPVGNFRVRSCPHLLRDVDTQNSICRKHVNHFTIFLKVALCRCYPSFSARRPTGRSKSNHRARRSPSGPRSEEHTSELQSLMRISYAVFCLNKKNNHKITNTTCQKNDLLY